MEAKIEEMEEQLAVATALLTAESEAALESRPPPITPPQTGGFATPAPRVNYGASERIVEVMAERLRGLESKASDATKKSEELEERLASSDRDRLEETAESARLANQLRASTELNSRELGQQTTTRFVARSEEAAEADRRARAAPR